MLFQNGKISFHCNKRAATRDGWHVEMVRQVEPVQVNGTGPWLRLPVAVHANYCDVKTHELDIRGLWLLDDTQAQTQSPAQTLTHNGTAPSNAR